MKTLNCQATSHWVSTPPTENERSRREPRSGARGSHAGEETSSPSAVNAVRDTLDCALTRALEQQYGAHWEKMHKYSKLTFRAILSLYIFWSHWQAAVSPQDLMAEAIEQTNSDLHLDDPEIYSAIATCTELPLFQLEALLAALSEQIREECWSQNGNRPAPRVEQP